MVKAETARINKIREEMIDLRNRSTIALTRSCLEKQHLIAENEAYTNYIESLEREVWVLGPKKLVSRRNFNWSPLNFSGVTVEKISHKRFAKEWRRCLINAIGESNMFIEQLKCNLSQTDEKLQHLQSLESSQQKEIAHIRSEIELFSRRNNHAKRRKVSALSNLCKSKLENSEKVLPLQRKRSSLQHSLQSVNSVLELLSLAANDLKKKGKAEEIQVKAHKVELEDQLEELKEHDHKLIARNCIVKMNSKHALNILQEHLSDVDDSCVTETEMEVVMLLSSTERCLEILKDKATNARNKGEYWNINKYNVDKLTISCYESVRRTEEMANSVLNINDIGPMLNIKRLTKELTTKILERESDRKVVDANARKLDVVVSKVQNQLKKLHSKVRHDSYKRFLHLDSLRKRLLYVVNQASSRENNLCSLYRSLQLCEGDTNYTQNRILLLDHQMKIHT